MRFVRTAVLATATCVVAVALHANSATRANAQSSLRKVSAGLLYIVADAGIILAKEKGYFAEEGLDVDLQRFVSGADQIPLLASGKLDVGSGSLTPGLLNAYRRGFKIPMVASKTFVSPDASSGSVMLVRADLYESGKVRSSAGLKKMKIGANNLESTMINHVVRGLATGGVKREDVTLVEMPFSQFVPALQNKAVDAVFTLSPLTEVIADRMKLAVRLPETELAKTEAHDTSNVLFYSESFAQSEAGKKFMVAFLKAQRDYHEALFGGTGNRNEICGMLNKHIPYVSKDCSGMGMSTVDPDGHINVASLEAYQKEWIEWGLMTESVDLRSVVNTKPLEFALTKLGKYKR